MKIQYWCDNKVLKSKVQRKREVLPCVGDYVSIFVVDTEDKDLDELRVFRVKKRYFVAEGHVVRLMLERNSERMVCGDE